MTFATTVSAAPQSCVGAVSRVGRRCRAARLTGRSALPDSSRTLVAKGKESRAFSLCRCSGLGLLLVALLIAAFPAMAQTTNLTGFATFEIINQRNIFDQSRMPHERAAEPARVPDSFSLVGTLFYAGGDVAFFDGTSSEFRKALKVGGEIAGFKVTAVTFNSVTLSDGSNETVLKISTQMRRDDAGQWSVLAERAAYSTVASSISAGSANTFSRSSRHTSSRPDSTATAKATPDTPAPSGGANSALERLMQRRAQQEQQLGQRQ